mgnify:CR=1 FL=1
MFSSPDGRENPPKVIARNEAMTSGDWNDSRSTVDKTKKIGAPKKKCIFANKTNNLQH